MDNEERILLLLRELKQNVQNLTTAVAKIEIEHGSKLQALIDAQVAFEEHFFNHEPRLVALETKTEKHDVELTHLLRKAK